MADPSLLSLTLSVGIPSGSAILAVVVTYILTKKREHEGDWRKLKFSQYQEFILALSGTVSERATAEARSRYADAINSMALVAPLKVLQALSEYQDEISSAIRENRKPDDGYKLLSALFHTMREDIQPRIGNDANFQFRLMSAPSEARTDQSKGR